MASLEYRLPVPAHPLASARSHARVAASAMAVFVFVIWLIPIKWYHLPVNLPFDLEVYRIFIGGLVLLFVTGILLGEIEADRTDLTAYPRAAAGTAAGGAVRPESGGAPLVHLGAVVVGSTPVMLQDVRAAPAVPQLARLRFSAGGHAKPVLLLAAVVLGSELVNLREINESGLAAQSLKALAGYVSLLTVFVLAASAIQTVDDARRVLGAIAIGAAIVAPLALYESKVKDSPFFHLDEWIPFLDKKREIEPNFRGRLRVRASAQHPIALGAALALSLPLALYFWRRATTDLRRWLWLGACLVIAWAALATISRTVVIMFAAMAFVGLLLRGSAVVRYWPLLPVLVLITHVATPGALGDLYGVFRPEGGLVAAESGREGMQGSGRISDLRPGLERWKQRPLFGKGAGTTATREVSQIEGPYEDKTIYDNQYMLTLVSLGALGLIATVWLVWGSAIKIFSAARMRLGRSPPDDLLVACAAGCFGFALSMFTFDAFAFVQVTLLFLVIAAVGLRASQLLREEASRPDAVASA